MTRVEVEEALRGFIVQRGRASAEDVHRDTPILERRILTSLDVMELVLFIEDLRGRPVDVAQLGVGVFRTIDAMVEAFFAEAP